MFEAQVKHINFGCYLQHFKHIVHSRTLTFFIHILYVFWTTVSEPHFTTVILTFGSLSVSILGAFGQLFP